MKRLQGGRIRSVGTARNYQQRLVQIAVRLDVSLTALTPEGAVAYLRRRAAGVGQKTLDMERQAIQAMMVDVTGRMVPGHTLPVVKSATPQQLKPRAYSPRTGPCHRRPPGPPQRARHRDRVRLGDPRPRTAHPRPTGRAAARRPAWPVAAHRHRRRRHEVRRPGRRGLHRRGGRAA